MKRIKLPLALLIGFLLISFGISIFSVTVYAATVSIGTARQVAINWLNKKIYMKPGLLYDESRVSQVFTETKESEKVYYVINLEPEGWVIVSADDIAYPIVAYSEKGSYSEEDYPPAFDARMENVKEEICSEKGSCSEENHPPAFDAWMENVKEEIYYAITNQLTPLTEAGAAWDALDVPAEDFIAEDYIEDELTVGAPLIQTTWSQGGKSWFCPLEYCILTPFLCAWSKTYDEYCPWERHYACPWYTPGGPFQYYRVAPTGCVATAMAQIMKYHNWPPKGKGQKTWDPPYVCEYECSGYDSETRNFGARLYNWASMPLHNANSAIALAMRDIGHAVKMNYTPSGSGANTSGDAVYAFETYFRYDKSAYWAWKSSYSTATWTNKLRTELDAGRPICYRGQNAGGHAFVCDGYDAPDHFHFNWGWAGSYDGYFYLNDLTPGSYDFTSSQGGIFDLKPVRVPILTTAAISSITPTSAVSGGNITDDNCSPVTARGVCWNTTGNPIIDDDKTTDGSGTGSYTSVMTGLTSDTTYYVRAYAVNLSGTGYGNKVSFTTAANACKGDFDDDGDVDGSDLAVFAVDFGRTDCGTGEPCEGDFDGDGDVDGSDLAVFAADFGRTDCLD